MDIEIRHLRLLVAIADGATMARAAASVAMKPAAAVALLRRLEDRLGTVLFTADGDVALPTAAGRSAVRRARRALRSVQDLDDEVRSLQSRTGVIRVLSSLVPFELLVAFLREQLPDLEWRLRSSSADDAVATVAVGDADLFFGLTVQGDREWRVPPGVLVQYAVEETPCLTMARSHPLAGRGAVELAELAGSPWALPPEPGIERLVRDACRRTGFEPDIRHRPDGLTAVTELVAAGLAVSLSSPVSVQDERVAFVRCRAFPAWRWTVAHRRGLDPRVVPAVLDVARGAYAARAADLPGLVMTLPPEVVPTGHLPEPPAPGAPGNPIRFGAVGHASVAPAVRALLRRGALALTDPGPPQSVPALIAALRSGRIDLALLDGDGGLADGLEQRTLVPGVPCLFLAWLPGRLPDAVVEEVAAELTAAAS